MLIGIMQHASRETGHFSPFEYQCQVLQRCDVLPKTNTRSTRENVLETLRTFKQEWHRSQQFFIPFDVSRATGLCPDVVIEITKYLSLIDAINTFSISILPLLREAHSRVHLNHPSTRLVEILPQHLDPRQIASIHIIDDARRPRYELSAFRVFDQLATVTILCQLWTQTIGRILPYFPRVRRLSLWFDAQLNSDFFQDLRELSSYPITHLHIRCASVRFDDFANGNRKDGDSKNTTITSFVLDTTYKQMNRHSKHFSLLPPGSPFLNFPMELITFFSDVRRVRLLVDRYELKSLVRVDQWEQLIDKCPQLDRLTIQLVKSEEFRQEALIIEQKLRQTRPGIIFRIRSA